MPDLNNISPYHVTLSQIWLAIRDQWKEDRQNPYLQQSELNRSRRRDQKRNAKYLIVTLRWLFGPPWNCRVENPIRLFFLVFATGGAGAAYFYRRSYALFLLIAELPALLLIMSLMLAWHPLVLIATCISWCAARAGVALLATHHLWYHSRQQRLAELLGRHPYGDKPIRHRVSDDSGKVVWLH